MACESNRLILSFFIHIFVVKSADIFGYWRISFYLCGMDELTKKILEEADNLDAYLMDEVETLFLDQNTLNLIDWDADDWQDKLKAEMSPIERDWYDTVEDIQESIAFFKAKYEED